ncbi:MAG: hypothetical protein KGL39_32590 [Patescibacteria group bacterium]|nr:hypothetical protein [Patescibacteria group bacterium]
MDNVKLDAALTEFARLFAENPEVMDDVARFLRERPHTATVTLRFHGARLQCADLQRVSKAAS